LMAHLTRTLGSGQSCCPSVRPQARRLCRNKGLIQSRRGGYRGDQWRRGRLDASARVDIHHRQGHVIRHAVVTVDWRIRRDPNDTLKRLKELVADQLPRAALGFVTCFMPRTWALRRRIRIVHFGKIQAVWLISSRQCCATASPTRPNRQKHLHRRAKARRLAATHPSRPTLAQGESRRDL
jgi:hypothetical protein